MMFREPPVGTASSWREVVVEEEALAAGTGTLEHLRLETVGAVGHAVPPGESRGRRYPAGVAADVSTGRTTRL